MKLKDLAKEELSNLKPLAKRFQAEVEHELSKINEKKVRLYLPEKEMYRLLKLRSWTEKYSVDLQYILRKLLPFWQQFVRKKTLRIKSEGLGVRVGTLTGKKSEEMLRVYIQEDFPSGQNEQLRRAHRQETIIAKYVDREKKGEIKTEIDVARGLFDFKDPDQFVKYYKKRIRKHTLQRERVVEEITKRPFRGNPFL